MGLGYLRRPQLGDGVVIDELPLKGLVEEGLDRGVSAPNGPGLSPTFQ